MDRKALGLGLVIGLTVGAVGAVASALFPGWPLPLLPDSAINAIPTRVLGRMLVGPGAGSFAGDSRGHLPSQGAIIFYNTPTPVTGFLCEVSAIGVPSEVWRGGSREDEDRTIAGYVSYAVWSDPSGSGAGHSGCAAYRDFKNLFQYAGPGEPGDAVAILDNAHDAAFAALPFDVSCVQLRPRDLEPQPCDGVARLQALDLKDLTSVTTFAAASPNGAGLYRFILREPDSYLPFSEIRVSVTQVGEAGPRTIKAVTIEVQPSSRP